MSPSELCRVCAKFAKAVSSQTLFERAQRKLLRQVEQVTGQKLKNLKELPQSICQKCIDELKQAYAFRERCIASQKYYASSAYRGRDNKRRARHKQTNPIPPNQVHNDAAAHMHDEHEDDELPIEKSELTKMYAIKEETGKCHYKKSDDKSPVHILYEVKDELPIEELDLTKMYSMKEETEDGAQSEQQANDSLSETSLIDHNDGGDDDEFVSVPGIAESKALDERIEMRKSRTPIKTNSSYGFEQLKTDAPKKRKPRGDRLTSAFICDQCGNHFTCRHHFATHLRRHMGDKRHQCEICPDKFFTPSELKRHMRVHTGERPFQCQFCARRFTDYSTRVKHERTHTNTRPFSCKQCGKAFTTTYILKNHMLVHTGERSFRCELCNKAFQRQSHLVVHERSLMHKQLVEAEHKSKIDLQRQCHEQKE